MAGDLRSGGLKADVVWACDPLTMQDYVDQGLVGGFVPEDVSAIPEQFRTEEYVGAAMLYMVAVHGEAVSAPQSWSDLAGKEYDDGVALPDPAFAASALGALGYFSQQPNYGLGFYRDLERNGAKQVSTPDDVTIGVAEGVYRAGITIEKSAFVAKESSASCSANAVSARSPTAVLHRPAPRSPVRCWTEGTTIVSPDWSVLVERTDELLDDYRKIFGG